MDTSESPGLYVSHANKADRGTRRGQGACGFAPLAPCCRPGTALEEVTVGRKKKDKKKKALLAGAAAGLAALFAKRKRLNRRAR